jgi:hypothetical protein
MHILHTNNRNNAKNPISLYEGLSAISIEALAVINKLILMLDKESSRM